MPLRSQFTISKFYCIRKVHYTFEVIVYNLQIWNVQYIFEVTVYNFQILLY